MDFLKVLFELEDLCSVLMQMYIADIISGTYIVPLINAALHTYIVHSTSVPALREKKGVTVQV